MMKLIVCGLFLMLMACATNQGPIESCEGCQSEDLKAFEQLHEAEFTAAMQATLDQIFKDKSQGISDPDKLKAMQVLAKTDAAKSYAFTQVYGVSAQYCGPEVAAALSTYESRASNIIALGRYYYQHGIEAQLGDQDFSQSGADLTAGLLTMTEELDQEHQVANQQQLDKKCREAQMALSSLTVLYGH